MKGKDSECQNAGAGIAPAVLSAKNFNLVLWQKIYGGFRQTIPGEAFDLC
jgi:hypothetical protein